MSDDTTITIKASSWSRAIQERDMAQASEAKLRTALHSIAKLDTSQGATPEQCASVLIAMDALGL